MNTVLIGLGLVGLLAVIAYFWGRSGAQKKTAQKAAKTGRRMAKAAANAPKTKSELKRRLKKGSF